MTPQATIAAHAATDWKTFALELLRDEVRAEYDIVDHPEDYGMVYRRIDHHLTEVFAILNGIVRMRNGEDPFQATNGTLDEALVHCDLCVDELKDLAARIERVESVPAEV